MTLSGKYENVLILVDVHHVEGLAVPLGYVVGPPFKLIMMQYCFKGKVKSFRNLLLRFLGIMAPLCFKNYKVSEFRVQ